MQDRPVALSFSSLPFANNVQLIRVIRIAVYDLSDDSVHLKLRYFRDPLAQLLREAEMSPTRLYGIPVSHEYRRPGARFIRGKRSRLLHCAAYSLQPATWELGGSKMRVWQRPRPAASAHQRLPIKEGHHVFF